MTEPSRIVRHRPTCVGEGKGGTLRTQQLGSVGVSSWLGSDGVP